MNRMTFEDLQKVLSTAAKRALEANAAFDKKIGELLQSGAIGSNDDIKLVDCPELVEKVDALAALTDLWLDYHNHIRFIVVQHSLMDDKDRKDIEVFPIYTEQPPQAVKN